MDLKDLQKAVRQGKRFKYVYFWGHKKPARGVNASCFSQWFGAPFKIDGNRYPTAEHYMMAEKARLFEDFAVAEKILNAGSPGEAKALGRKVLGFDEAVWEQHRSEIVVRANQAKFSQHPELGSYLKNTGNRVLVEASPVDRIWGVGLAKDNPTIENPLTWNGLNLLGFALMKVRAGLE